MNVFTKVTAYEGLYSSHKYMKRNMQGVFINANIRAVGLVIRQQEKLDFQSAGSSPNLTYTKSSVLDAIRIL